MRTSSRYTTNVSNTFTDFKSNDEPSIDALYASQRNPEQRDLVHDFDSFLSAVRAYTDANDFDLQYAFVARVLRPGIHSDNAFCKKVAAAPESVLMAFLNCDFSVTSLQTLLVHISSGSSALHGTGSSRHTPFRNGHLLHPTHPEYLHSYQTLLVLLRAELERILLQHVGVTAIETKWSTLTAGRSPYTDLDVLLIDEQPHYERLVKLKTDRAPREHERMQNILN